MTLLERDRENREEGFAEGREEGLEEGQENMAALIKILLEENRTDDLKRASEDTDFRKDLLEKYDISQQ